jgi:hypothetical protein
LIQSSAEYDCRVSGNHFLALAAQERQPSFIANQR